MTLWDAKAALYDELRRRFPFNIIHRRELIQLRSLLSQLDLHPGSLLDVGTGTGTAITALPPVSRTIASDLSLSMLVRTRQNYRCACVNCSALQLGFKSDAFELVLAIGLSEYVADAQMLLKELARVTKHAGYIVFTFSHKNVANRLRIVWGHRLYLLSLTAVKHMAEEMDLKIIDCNGTWLQQQLLLKKK